MYSFGPACRGRSQAVAHVDMDCFFASCDRLRRPELVGKPLVVAWGASRIRGSRNPRGVVVCAGYEVRPLGVRAGMSLAQALRRAPAAVYIEPSHGLYGRKSDEVYELLRRYSPTVERASVDEFYIDLTGCCGALGRGDDWTRESLLDLGREIRAWVRQAAGLPCSLGIARNRMLAKIASDASKPNGVLSLEPDKEPMFLDSLPIDVLPGVGPQTKVLFQRLGVFTVADFKRFPASTWSRLLGRWGESLVRSAAGECDRRVEAGDRSAFQDRTDPALPTKSASANTTLLEDTRDPERLKRLLLGLVERVCPRLREMRVRAQTVTVRVRYSDFEEHTRAATLASPTDWEPDAFRSAVESFDALWQAGRPVRLIGVTLSHFAAAAPWTDLFGRGRRIERLERSIDAIRERFGRRAIQFASSVIE